MIKRRSNESTNSYEGSKKTPRWHSNHDKKAEGFPGTQTVKRIRTSQWPHSKVDSDYHWIKFSSTKTVEYQASELKVIQSDIFYVPNPTNQVAIDSFIVSNGCLYMFQFTIASTHSINAGIVPFFSRFSLPPKTMWRFVFVVPPGSKLSCPQPRDLELKELLTEMKLFSAELDPSKLDLDN
jgi:hypothetical protein